MISVPPPLGHVVCILTRAMLPPYIIDQLRRRERAKKSKAREEQPRVEIPVPLLPAEPKSEEPEDRGVTIIDVF